MIAILCSIYIVTFMVFPGVTNLAELSFLDTKGVWFQNFWMTCFNLFDTIGRFFGEQPWAFMN